MKVRTITKPLTGWHMLVMFISFFGVVIAVNLFMALMAVHSWTGLVVENSYVASQNFNDDVASLKKSAALGIEHHLHTENGKLHLSLQNANGRPVNADMVQIAFERPMGASREQILAVMRISDGQYEAPAILTNGVWNGELSARLGDNILWRQPFRLIVTGE